MSNLPLQPSSPSPHSKASGTPPANWSYEATVSRIETIITRIEAGDLELADVFAQFASAVEHLQQCETFLQQQQQQMDLLIETLMDEPEAF